MKSLTFLNKRTGKSDCRLYSCVRIIIMNFLFWGLLGWEIWPLGWDIPPFCMKHCVISLDMAVCFLCRLLLFSCAGGRAGGGRGAGAPWSRALLLSHPLWNQKAAYGSFSDWHVLPWHVHCQVFYSTIYFCSARLQSRTSLYGWHVCMHMVLGAGSSLWGSTVCI